MGKLFISYRRKDALIAHRLADKLQELLDAVIFIDRKIPESDWVAALESEVQSCNVFLLLVTENTFDESRIHNEDDWIRREIALALTLKKPIVLVRWEKHDPPARDKLPENIADITTKQGLILDIHFFDEGASGIAQQCVDVSKGALRLKVKDSVADKNTGINQTASGNQNVQVAVGSAQNSTVIGQQINSDNRRRDALAKIETLRKDREESVKRLNQLNYHPKSSITAEGRIFQLIPILFILVVGFAIHTLVGVGAIGLIGAYFVMRSNASNQSNNMKQAQINEVEERIRKLDREIEKQRDIERKL